MIATQTAAWEKFLRTEQARRAPQWQLDALAAIDFGEPPTVDTLSALQAVLNADVRSRRARDE